MKKTPQAPKLFRRIRTPKQLNSRVLRRIHLPGDKAFVQSMYEDVAEGQTLRLRSELSADELKKLRSLAKAIKASRGFLHPVKVGLLVVVVAAALVFNFVFRDILVQRAFERGLEEVFQARSEVDGLRVRLLEPAIEFETLNVGDQRKPMQNLFTLGSSRIELSLRELLRRRLIVEDFLVSEISFGTPRTSSALLPPERRRPEADHDGSGVSELIPALPSLESLGLAELDARALIESEVQSLATTAAIEAGIAEFEARIDFWEQRVGTYVTRVNEMQELSASLIALRPQDIRSVSEAREVYDRVLGGVNTIQGSIDEVESLGSEIQQEGDLLWNKVTELQSTIEEDLTHLVSLLPSPAEAGAGLATALLGPELIERLIELRNRVEDGRTQLERLQQLARERNVQQERGRRGRIVNYPTAELPRFAMLQAAVSGIWDDDSPERYEGTLRALSSDPDLLDQPSVLTFSRAAGERIVALDTQLDLRSEATIPARLELTTSGYPYTSPSLPPQMGIRRLSADSDWSLEIDIDTDNQTSGTLGLELTALNLESLASPSVPAQILIDVLQEADSLQLEAAFSFHPRRTPTLRVRSNIENELSRRVRAYAEERLAELEARLRAELESYIEDQLELFDPYLAQFNDLRSELDEYQAMLESYLVEAQQQRARVEQQLAGYQAELDQIRREAEAQARAAAAAAQAEADAARAEAERRATEEQARLEAETQRRQAEADAARREAEAEAERQRREAEAEAARRQREAEEAARREAEQRAREALPRRLF